MFLPVFNFFPGWLFAELTYVFVLHFCCLYLLGPSFFSRPPSLPKYGSNSGSATSRVRSKFPGRVLALAVGSGMRQVGPVWTWDSQVSHNAPHLSQQWWKIPASKRGPSRSFRGSQAGACVLSISTQANRGFSWSIFSVSGWFWRFSRCFSSIVPSVSLLLCCCLTAGRCFALLALLLFEQRLTYRSSHM